MQEAKVIYTHHGDNVPGNTCHTRCQRTYRLIHHGRYNYLEQWQEAGEQRIHIKRSISPSRHYVCISVINIKQLLAATPTQWYQRKLQHQTPHLRDAIFQLYIHSFFPHPAAATGGGALGDMISGGLHGRAISQSYCISVVKPSAGWMAKIPLRTSLQRRLGSTNTPPKL